MSSQTGKCVVRIQSGMIIDVHVTDSRGQGTTMAPDVYVSRGIQPPLNSLPDCSQAGSKQLQ
jgi:hypothetical protein